jgi:anti-anti-sigma regulatory factor
MDLSRSAFPAEIESSMAEGLDVELRGMRIFTEGELTLVTFENKGSLGRQTFIGEAAEHLDRIVEEHDSKVLVIDLTRITVLPSDMIGVLVGLQHRGIQIRLFNVTDDVRLTLETMSLDDLFDLREGDLSSLIDASTEE